MNKQQFNQLKTKVLADILDAYHRNMDLAEDTLTDTLLHDRYRYMAIGIDSLLEPIKQRFKEAGKEYELPGYDAQGSGQNPTAKLV